MPKDEPTVIVSIAEALKCGLSTIRQPGNVGEIILHNKQTIGVRVVRSFGSTEVVVTTMGRKRKSIPRSTIKSLRIPVALLPRICAV